MVETERSRVTMFLQTFRLTGFRVMSVILKSKSSWILLELPNNLYLCIAVSCAISLSLHVIDYIKVMRGNGKLRGSVAIEDWICIYTQIWYNDRRTSTNNQYREINPRIIWLDHVMPRSTSLGIKLRNKLLLYLFILHPRLNLIN